jgi:hypothetical protein
MKVTVENANIDVSAIRDALIASADVAGRIYNSAKVIESAARAFIELKGVTRFRELDDPAKAELAVFLDRFQGRLIECLR